MKLPEIKRRVTRPVNVGGVVIGGDGTNPVVIQSMTNTPTADAQATLAQVRQLARAGARLVRLAVPSQADTASLGEIVACSPVPIVADVHFHFERAMESIAAGAAKIRLNPGNIADRDQVLRVIDAANAAGVAIRIGVNEGSVLGRRDKQQLARDRDRPLVELMVEKLAEYLEIFDRAGFERLVLSAKSHDAFTNIAANRAIAKRWDYPLHLGVTHAGTVRTGAIRSAASIGTLLSEGIGETVRISYAGDPVAEVRDAKELLASLRLAPRQGAELIACPTCGRLQTKLQPILEEIERALAEIELAKPITVAVMGCVVNGPGEAAGADVAICAGKNKALLYVQGKKIRTIPPEEITQAVLTEVRKLGK